MSQPKPYHSGFITIVGRPNVGKSTLMNLLAGTQKSIVTAIPGTTRDVVEETVRAGEIVLRLADTAGIRDTDDPVEQAGVALARRRLESAQLVLAVLDRSEPLGEGDLSLLSELDGRPAIAVLNKSDLPAQLDENRLRGLVSRTVEISARTGEGAESLVRAIADLLHLSDVDPAAPLLANERQRGCLQKAAAALEEALRAVESGVTLDAVTVCLDEAIGPLLELTGRKASDAVVDAVFAQFCVGK